MEAGYLLTLDLEEVQGGQPNRLLLHGTILWTLWLRRLDMVWNSIAWQMPKVYYKIWHGLVYYGRNSWEKMEKYIYH
jgi:hypothetical protein